MDETPLIAFERCDTFTQMYITAALWSSVDTGDNMRRAAKKAGYVVEKTSSGKFAFFVSKDDGISVGSPNKWEYEFEMGEGGAWEAAYHHKFGKGTPDEALDANYEPKHLAPALLQQMFDDCVKFQLDNLALLEAAYDDDSLPVNQKEDRAGRAGSAGYDFWMTRSGSGVGFWDGDWDSREDDGAQYGDRLTAAAKQFKNVDLYVGDDGLIYGE